MRFSLRCGIGLVVLGLAAGLAGCSQAKKEEVPAPGQAAPAAAAVDPADGGQLQASGCTAELTDVFFLSPATLPPGADPIPTDAAGRVGFITGGDFTLLRTADGGAGWQRVLEPPSNAPALKRIHFLNRDEGWVAGRDIVLRTLDGGLSWTPQPNLPENFYYFGPSAASASSYYQMQPPTCGATLWQARRGGGAWQALPARLPHNDYGAVFFFDDRHGWVSGNYGRVARTADGGQTWQTQTLKDGGRLAQIQFVSPQVGWLRPDQDHQGRIWATRDGGRTWQAQEVGVPSTWDLGGLQFLDEKTGFLLARGGSKESQIKRTLDGGRTWALFAAHPVFIAALCFVSAEEGWVVGHGGYVFHHGPPAGGGVGP